jgi:hypothetical protein
VVSSISLVSRLESGIGALGGDSSFRQRVQSRPAARSAREQIAPPASPNLAPGVVQPTWHVQDWASLRKGAPSSKCQRRGALQRALEVSQWRSKYATARCPGSDSPNSHALDSLRRERCGQAQGMQRTSLRVLRDESDRDRPKQKARLVVKAQQTGAGAWPAGVIRASHWGKRP